VNQLALFDLPAALPAPARRDRPVEQARKENVRSTRAALRVGTLVDLPITASIQGEKWRQYTTGLSGRVEVIEDGLAGVRVVAPGNWLDGRLAVVEIRS